MFLQTVGGKLKQKTPALHWDVAPWRSQAGGLVSKWDPQGPGGVGGTKVGQLLPQGSKTDEMTADSLGPGGAA